MFYLLFQVQFVINFTHSVNAIYNGCDFPLWGKSLITGYMIVLIILFLNFYIHSYVTRKRAASHKDKEAKRSKHITNGVNGITNGTPNGNFTNGISNGISNGAAKGNMSDKKVK